ncbi:Cleavage and polyadenylation specificity factor subunit 3-II [Vitis vinifera]|uniref:Cleavage and polyadenylation specificity factor subunit 3-II n=1 Tax=Vitis vinifera TaxID=29760 RepID=A0A438DGC8_VITVI|nr:Cleavage and polyadenylation specificity factor subunit 3-II [Vitis vinifera]
MGQGYEDHLVTQEADIPEVDRVQWRKIDAQLCSVLWQSVDPRILLHLQAYKTCFKFWTQAKGLYTNDIQRLYKVASAIVHLSQQDLDLSTYIGQIASLKEQFLTVMPLTPDVGLNKHSLTSSSWSLLLLASVRILSLFVIRFLVVHQFRSWMMCVRSFDRSLINAPGPCVLFATPGMISGGFSLEVFKLWAPSEMNLVTLPGGSNALPANSLMLKKDIGVLV